MSIVRGEFLFCDRVGLQKVVAAFEFEPGNDAALAGTIRTRKDRQNRHLLSRCFTYFSQDLKIPVAGFAGEKLNFKSPAVGMLHYIDPGGWITVKNRYT